MRYRPSTAFLVFAMLSSMAHGAVELRGVQACYGPYGPARTKLEVAPHDELLFRFTIAGLTVGADGKTNATLALTLTDAAGKEVLNLPRAIKVALPYGESYLAIAGFTVGATTAPGEYSLRVEVEDKLATGSARFVRKIKVLAPAFRLQNTRFFHDPARTLPGPCGGFAGQTLFYRAAVCLATQREGRTAVVLTAQVFDLEGTEVMRPALVTGREAADGKDYDSFAIEAELPLGRAGEFILRLTAVDTNAGSKTTLELPLSITQP